jgi:hypothetical protein
MDAKARRWSSWPSACAAKSRASTSPTRTATSIVEKDKRINAKHVRELEQSGTTHVTVPEDYPARPRRSRNMVDADTGEDHRQGQ